MRQTLSSRSKIRTERALAVKSRSSERKMSTRQRMNRLENVFHQAMVVMDTETGKPLNYKQLIAERSKIQEELGYFFRK